MVRRVSNESLVCVNYLLTIHVTVHPKINMQGMGEGISHVDIYILHSLNALCYTQHS